MTKTAKFLKNPQPDMPARSKSTRTKEGLCTMFVQISSLKDYSNSLPNRGLDGLAKRSSYGDEIRQRISSQCIKAGLRAQQPMIARIDGDDVHDDMRSMASRLDIGMSHRSRHVFDAVVTPALSQVFGSDDEAKAWSRALADLFLKSGPSEDGAKEDKSEKKDEKKETSAKPYSAGFMDQPIVIGEKEVEAIISVAKILRDSGISPEGQKAGSDLRALFEKRGAAKKLVKAMVEAKTVPAAEADAREKLLDDAIANIKSLPAHVGLDGALFGRMTTGSVVSRVESCVHVAHAITVHAIQATADYFSVQDTLKNEDDPGASHTNHVEIASGVFYYYVVIDLRQITQNFSSLTAEQQAEIVGWVVRAVYVSECSAKRGSTAGYGAGLYYLAEVGQRQPRTLAAAFQEALSLKGEGPLWRRAASRIKEHRADLNLKGGTPKSAYDTDQSEIQETARATNRAAYEIIADRVVADVLPWLRSHKVSEVVA
jgi:CRISPR system Cascade subunit CasC